MAEDLPLFGITGDWSTAALDPGVYYCTVRKGGCRLMVAWVKQEEKSSEHRQRKAEAEEADKVSCTWGDHSKLETFRAALFGPTQGLPKRCQLCRSRNLEP